MVIGWIFGILIGLFVGILTMVLVYSTKTAFGTLLIDRHDPEKDIYRYDIKGDLTDLPKKKRVVWKINSNADLSQD